MTATENTADGNAIRLSGRIRELDGIRGLAILMVLLWHYVQGGIPAGSGGMLSVVKQLLGSTWSGVDLFFVLSGFLIAGILIDHRGSGNYFAVFYLRRACRILPVYYLLVALFLVLGMFDLYLYPPLARLLRVTAIPDWSYWLFLQNLFMARAGDFGPEWLSVTWSLAVEEQFYLVLPLVVFLVPVRRLPVVFVFIIVMAVALRAFMPGASAYINTPWRADSLMAGALLAWLVREPGFYRSVAAGAGKRMLYGVFAFVLVVALLTNFSHQRPFNLVISYLWLACLYASLLLIVLVNQRGVIAGIFRSRILVWLGGISYAVYLFHQIVSLFLHGWLIGAGPDITTWRGAAVTMLATIVTLVLASLSYVVIERRLIRFGHRFRYREAVTREPLP